MLSKPNFLTSVWRKRHRELSRDQAGIRTEGLQHTVMPNCKQDVHLWTDCALILDSLGP